MYLYCQSINLTHLFPEELRKINNIVDMILFKFGFIVEKFPLYKHCNRYIEDIQFCFVEYQIYFTSKAEFCDISLVKDITFILLIFFYISPVKM